ncbi:MAG: hypothetical protein H8E49_05670 [Gammaproteobacteria bacterium]|nr:hypothetical protein [Gammaproteobacteria bacterium]
MNKIAKTSALLLVLTTFIVIAVAPIGPMPGIFIGGIETPVPDNWGNTANRDEIRLRVPGTIPRVVIIWVVEVDSELYVVGGRESGWVEMIGDSANVQMRAGDNTYSLNAVQVTSGLEPIVTADADKYRSDYPDIVGSSPPLIDAQNTVGVFKLYPSAL